MNSAFKSKNIFTNLKYAYQRIKKGYCDADLWEIDGWFLTVVPDMLKQFSKTHNGYPEILRRKYYEKNKNTLNITYEKFICDCGEKAGEAFDREWTEILNQMSEGFETLNNLRLNNYQSPKGKNSAEEIKNKAFDLFSEWFFNLWD